MTRIAALRTDLLLTGLVLCVSAACGDDAAALDAAVAPDAASPPDGAPPLDSAVAPDASPAPALGCLGAAAPTVAADPVSIRGNVFAVTALSVQPVIGASVALRRHGDDALLAETSSSGDGAGYELAIASGGVAVDGYLAVADPDHLPTRFEPAAPLVGDERQLVVVADASEITTWYATAGVEADPTTGPTVLAIIADCDGVGVAGATISVTPPAETITYWNDDAGAWDPALTSSRNGYALITGVAVTSSFTAALADQAFPARSVAAAAGELTMVFVGPRDLAR